MPDKNKLITRAASIPGKDSAAGQRAPVTLDKASRTVGVVLATENPARVWDWERGAVDEVLMMTGAEFGEQVPLLDAHNRFSVESQLGSLRDLNASGTELHATACFSTVEKAENAFRQVEEGHITDLSVGYRVLQSVWVPEGTTANVEGRAFTGPVKIVTRWRVKEGSLTPIGADEYAKVRSEKINDNPQEAATMPGTKEDNDLKGRTAPTAAAPPTDQAQNHHAGQPASSAENQSAQRAAHADTPPASSAALSPTHSADAMRAEYADMADLGMRHGMSDLAAQYMREGKGIDALRAAILDGLSKDSQRHAPGHRVEVGEGDSEKFRHAAADSLVMRGEHGFRMDTPAPGAVELRGYTMRELARECCRREGITLSGDPMTMIGRAFTSTSDFPAILADAAHNSVLMGAESAAETFDLWTGGSTATDFREHTGVSLDAFSSLDLIPEGSEYKMGHMSDRGVTYSVATYGKRFAITRQAVINDNLGMLTGIPFAMGRAALRTVGNIVYDLLLKNPQLADGNALFSTPHNNLAATGKALDIPSFGKAVTAMGTHKNSEGESLNIRPAFLIAPIALQASAFQLLHGQVVGTQAEPGKPNPWVGYVVPIPEGRLDGDGALPWFIAAEKGFAINVAWLGGNKTPRVEQRQGWSVDGTEYKVGLDTGAYVADWRGLYKNPGVVPA